MVVRRWLPAVIAVLLAGGGLLGWRLAAASSRTGDGLIPLSGRIEADDSAIAPKTSGRIIEILVREGDTVQAGDTIARLDDQQLRARVERRRR